MIEPGERADAITAFSYDGTGNLVAITDPNGHTTRSAYDPGQRLTGRTDALGGDTAFAHDALGRVIEVTAPNGAATAFTQDSLGRPLTESSPDRGDLVYTHDTDDRLLTRTDARGITATYSYDALDRLVAVRYPDPAEDIGLTYDDCPFGIGRLCAREDESGRYTFAYDAYGNLTRQEYTTEGITYVTTYAYDAAHRLVALGYPGGREVQFAYDAVGRLSEVATTVGGSPRILAGAVTWRADAPPSLQLRTVNLRFPRQYFDQETGLHQNWYRDYDPQTGRYVEADPIGLDGGVNTYIYVGANPLNYIDPLGRHHHPAHNNNCAFGDAYCAATGRPDDTAKDKKINECIVTCFLVGTATTEAQARAAEAAAKKYAKKGVQIVVKKIAQLATGPVGALWSINSCKEECASCNEEK